MAKKTTKTKLTEAVLADTIAATERLLAKTPRVPPIPPGDFLSLGMTLPNLAVSGRTNCGIPKGAYLYYVGDSSSGKTFFSLGMAAELCRNRKFDNYRIIYDASENGALMDVPTYFGDALAERLEPPRGTREEPVYSRTVEDFYFALDAAMDAGPCLFVEDSMDALLAAEDEERFGESRVAYEKAYESGKDAPAQSGTYGVAKAKTNSKNINRVVQRLKETGSILVVISQTRDKIGGGPFAPTRTRGGGRALKFYAHVEIWTSVKGPIKVNRMGKEREIGSMLQLDIQKNRISGWEGKIQVPFLRKLGLDDMGSLVAYLLDEGHWEKNKSGKISAPEFKYEGTADALIGHIENEGAERELQLLVGDVWQRIEAACAPARKSRYS